MDLSSAKLLITGAGRGIGQYLALQLLDSVEKLIVVDHDDELLSRLPRHPRLISFSCNLIEPEAVQKLIREIFADHGGINVCINNAGVIHSEPLINTLSKEEKKHSIESWKKVIDINLNAVFYVTANVVEQLTLHKQPGLIINISSISAQGNMGQSAYAASKAAVEALTKTWSKELGMFKIRTAAIAPGFFNTPSTKESLSEAMLSKWQKAVPLNRLGELDELLNAVRFVIENEYFNGKILSLDGGLTI
jgi:3-oxoacyl-[acyl-carrier protein] reductase